LPDHTVVAFDHDLHLIRDRVATLGRLVAQQVADAGAALMARDAATARTVIAVDREVDATMQTVETLIVETVARRQPLAVDLREIIGAFHISNDLGRAGDLAKNIAQRAIALNADVPTALAPKMRELALLVLTCLRSVLTSYVGHDDLRAAEVWNSDKDIDELQNTLFGEVLVCMMSDPHHITSCTHLLFCLKDLERIGDHATNIAESVRFIVTGERFVGDRPKGAQFRPAPYEPLALPMRAKAAEPLRPL
jgi:phosphate transport system protein